MILRALLCSFIGSEGMPEKTADFMGSFSLEVASIFKNGIYLFQVFPTPYQELQRCEGVSNGEQNSNLCVNTECSEQERSGAYFLVTGTSRTFKKFGTIVIWASTSLPALLLGPTLLQLGFYGMPTLSQKLH